MQPTAHAILQQRILADAGSRSSPLTSASTASEQFQAWLVLLGGWKSDTLVNRAIFDYYDYVSHVGSRQDICTPGDIPLRGTCFERNKTVSIYYGIS